MSERKNRVEVFNYDFKKSDNENRKEKETLKKQKAERRLYRDKLGRWCKRGKGVQLNIFKK